MKKIFKVVTISILILMLAGYGLLQLINSRDFQLFGGIVTEVKTKEKVVALTFDDGPTEKTDEILRILEEAGIKTTFFLTGKEIKANLDEAQKIVDAGHQLGNHTYSHQRMIFKSFSFIEEEIETTDRLIRKAGFEGAIPFRPPYGKKLLLLPYYLNQHDRKTILWSIEPESYPEIASDSKRITEHVMKNIKPGSIILLHVMYDSREESLNAVKGIVSELRNKGYAFKTVSQLLQYSEE